MSEVNVNSKYISAEAERGKFWPVDSEYLSSLDYPLSGRGKYAVLTYQVNSAPITLSGDVQMGSVEISDADTDDRVNVALDDTKNAMFVQSESLASESAIETLTGMVATETTLLALSGLVDGATQTPDSPKAPNVIQMGGISETTVPVGVGDGDAVAVWYDEFGRQVIAGYNPTDGALNVKVINDAFLNRTGVLPLHKGTAGDTSILYNLNQYSNIKIHVGVANTANFTFTVRQRLSTGTGWHTLYSTNLSLTGDAFGTETEDISLYGEVWYDIQTEISNHSGGNVNAVLIAGN